jgi:hypothetical protein
MTLHHPGGHAGCSGDTLASAFFVTGVRHAFAAVRILLEWEISRKSSGKSHLPLFSGLEYSLEHSDGYPYCLGHPGSRIPSLEVRSVSRRCPPVLCRARSTTPGAPHPPLPTLPTPIRSIDTATAGTTVLINEQLMALFEKPATAKRFMDTCYSSLFCKRTHRHVGNPLSF